MEKKGFNMEELKNKNIKLILSYLRRHGGSSRKTIAGELNLTTAALTNIANELLRDGLIVELGEVTEGKVGRKQRLIDIEGNGKIALGLEFKKRRIVFAAVNIKGDIQNKKEWVIEKNEYKLKLGEVLAYINEYAVSKIEKIIGLGILIPGYKEKDDRENVRYIKEKIREKIKLPVFYENNIRGLVTAELYLEKKYKNFWLVNYGPGVGSGIVLNNEVLKGKKNMAGEMGHIPLVENNGNYKCSVCGQVGCLESEIHFDRIKELYFEEGILKNQGETDMDFFRRIERNRGYKELKKNLDILGKYISIGFSILDPEKIVLSGEIFSEKILYDYIVERIINCNSLICSEDIEYMNNYSHKREVAGGVLVFSKYFEV